MKLGRPIYIRSILFDILLYVLLVVMGLLLLPCTLSRKWTYRAIRTYCALVLWLLEVLCKIRTEVRGDVPHAEVLICAKHHSFLDILILSRYLPQAKFIMKRELRYIPIFGQYALRMGSTPVARGRRGRAMKEMVAHVEEKGGSGGQLVIYPQGTRVAPGARLPYKIGAGVLYERLGIPCVPVATNAGVFWGRRKWWRRPGTAVVEFLEPIPPGLPMKEFMEQIESVVEGASDALMREAGFDPGAVSRPRR